jgi:hypothetical protein
MTIRGGGGGCLYNFLIKTRFGLTLEHGFVTADMLTSTTTEKNRSRRSLTTKLLHQGWQKQCYETVTRVCYTLLLNVRHCR